MIKHKFHAKPTTIDGIYFGSKKESKRYMDLLLLQKSGEVLFHLRQAPFHLPGNVRYVVDFIVFWSNGDITFEDVKGLKTVLFETKRKILEDLFPIKITEI